MNNEIKNKVILVTGGTGTIGSELVRQLLVLQPKQVRIFSRDDTKQYQLLEELNYPKNMRLLIGDIRDKNRLQFAFNDVDVVFHAAALKHVPLCEYNPFEAIQTNVIGSQNVIEAALAHRVKKVCFISTDKAANPINILGVTKALMEKLAVSANYYKGPAITKFFCLRFGNVAWARGSVLPIWRQQAEKFSTIKLTNPEMTRFLMSIRQAVKLVLDATSISQGGEIFVLKMPSIKLIDLAKMFIEKYFPEKPVAFEITGDRDGEKLHEDLIGVGERFRDAFENDNMLLLTPNPQLLQYYFNEASRKYPGFKINSILNKYSSEDHVDIAAVKQII